MTRQSTYNAVGDLGYLLLLLRPFNYSIIDNLCNDESLIPKNFNNISHLDGKYRKNYNIFYNIKRKQHRFNIHEIDLGYSRPHAGKVFMNLKCYFGPAPRNIQYCIKFNFIICDELAFNQLTDIFIFYSSVANIKINGALVEWM